MLPRLFIAALWSPAGKELTSWLLFVMFNSVFVTFPMWYPGSGVILDLCRLSYFVFVILPRLFIATLWSPSSKGLTSWLSFVMFNCFFFLFPMWYRGSGVVLDCIDS